MKLTRFVTLVVAMLFAFTYTFAYAKDLAISEYRMEDAVMQHTDDPSPESRMMCANPNCGWYCYDVCVGEWIVYDEGTHGNCYVYLVKSRGGLVCSSCLTVWQVYGYHDCWEIHDTCSKGNYRVCPMQIK